MKSIALRAALAAILLPLVFAGASLPAADEAPAAAKKVDPLDWPTWRGPEQNGISREKGLPAKWDPDGGPGSNLIWKSEELATRSTPIVMNGRLYTLARADQHTPIEGEQVICADAATGKVLWRNKFNAYLSDVPAERVAWSCVTGDPATDRVYALGVCGYFQCLDGATGKTLWSRSLKEEFGLLDTFGGRTNTPVIFDDLVIVSGVIIGWGERAKPQDCQIAFNKNTGQCVWFVGTSPLPDDTTYSTPFVTVIDGQAQMIFGSGDGCVWGFQPRTGKRLWSYDFSARGLNVSPVVVDGRVYVGQSEENFDDRTSMGALACIDAAEVSDSDKAPKPKELWREKRIMAGKVSPVVVDGRAYYGEDGGGVLVIDAATGKQIGRKAKLAGTIMRSSLLFADGKLYANTTGAWHVFEPTKTGLKLLNRMRMPSGGETHGSPIVSHGRIYLPTTAAMYCIALPDVKPSADPIPGRPQEAPVADDQTPAQIQVVPAEVLMHTGDKRQFTVRLFNARGQFLKESKATFSLEGPGQISGTGEFVAPDAAKPAATILTAKVGDLTGQVRIRSIPPLPWKFDFEDVPLAPHPTTGAMEGEPPSPWVGIRYRHKVRQIDGNNVLVKVDYIPKGTRSQGWMGVPDEHDYTIQADVYGTTKENKMPNIGITAQRYVMDLMGESQQIQIRTWHPQLRMAKTVPFKWTPNTWYTMKLRAETADGKAILRGKVWKRDEKEPADWMIVAEDASPNLVGSPGLMGEATFAELYYDNITVTPNK